MKRPIIIILFSYIIGILGGLYLKSMAFIFYGFIILILFCINKINNKYLRFIRRLFESYTYFLILIFLIIGYLYTSFLENRYNTVYNNDEEIKEYCIVGDKEEKQYKTVYKVKIINSKVKERNGTYLYINVSKKNNIQYGDLIYINGKYMEPDIDRNEKGFNYKDYLKTLKIYGTVNVENYKIISNGKINKIFLYSNKLKEKLKKNVEKIISNEEYRNLLIAMVLGDTDNLNEKIKDDFLNSNLYHILSVSGGQVSNIIIGITILTSLIKVHKKITNIICIFILTIFMFITGLTPSIIRACIMCIISLLSSLIKRRYDIANSFGSSLLVILFDNPFAIMSLSVLLSYFGFLGIIILGSFFIKKVNKILKKNIIKHIFNIVISSVAAQIFIFPIILYVFGTISLTFIFSNLLIIPLSTIITILGFFIMIFPIKIFGIVTKLIYITIKVVGFFSNIGISKIYFISPNIIEIIIYYLFIIYLYYLIKRDYMFKLKHFIYKYKTKMICLILIFTLITFIFPKEFELHFIDVGQGDCTLITTDSNKKILIDGGGSELNKNFDVGEKTILPYLLKNKISMLDYIIISHFDFDHVGGLYTILKEINIKNIIIGKQYEISENYEQFIKIIKEKNIKLHIVEAGEKIVVDKDTNINIIWPSTKNKINENSINNNSLVFKLNYKNFSILFTGDIEEIAEKSILNMNRKVLKSDILKVAHHGSKTSSCSEFLKAVNPRISLIGVGKNNNFGHPSEITITNLKKIKSKIYRTDLNGGIQIKIKQNGKIILKPHLNV